MPTRMVETSQKKRGIRRILSHTRGLRIAQTVKTGQRTESPRMVYRIPIREPPYTPPKRQRVPVDAYSYHGRVCSRVIPTVSIYVAFIFRPFVVKLRSLRVVEDKALCKRSFHKVCLYLPSLSPEGLSAEESVAKLMINPFRSKYLGKFFRFASRFPLFRICAALIPPGSCVKSGSSAFASEFASVSHRSS